MKPKPNQGQNINLFPIILYSELRKGKLKHVGSVAAAAAAAITFSFDVQCRSNDSEEHRIEHYCAVAVEWHVHSH